MRTKTFILYYSTFLFGLQDPFSVLVKFLTGAVCISGMIPNAAGAAACRSEKEALRALPVPEYRDGIYTAAVSSTTAAGTEDVEVTVTIEGSVITGIEVNAPLAAQSLGQSAIKYMPERILEAQKTEGVDVFSGCSLTSQAILDAVAECLAQACAE